MAQRAVKRRFKKTLPKAVLQQDIEKSTATRHVWAYTMRMRYGPEPQEDYPLPMFPCLSDTVSETVEHHYSVHEWSCPVAHYHSGLGRLVRESSRLVDSSGLIEPCVVFESVETPKNVPDLKKVERRQGSRTTAIGLKDEIDEEGGQSSNPQDDNAFNPSEPAEPKRNDKPPQVPPFQSESNDTARLT